MISAFFVGLTIGIVGKYLIHGNYSSQFTGPILISLLGSFQAHSYGVSSGRFDAGDPDGFVATILGSLIALMIYNLVVKARYRAH